jgi:hypothetical protein
MPTTARSRTIIVCLPTGTVGDMFAACTTLADHTEGPATLDPRYTVRRPRLTGWISRFLTTHLIAARRTGATVARTAGGRLGRLNLLIATQTAYLDAAARWATWRSVTAGLDTPTPWRHHLARHQTHPVELPLDEVRRAFLAQPAIVAMLAHNAVPRQRLELNPYEVDAYSAGLQTYTTLHMLTAIAGHGMLTADGRFLQPASECVIDVLTYLKEAAGHLHSLPRRTQIVAVTI